MRHDFNLNLRISPNFTKLSSRCLSHRSHPSAPPQQGDMSPPPPPQSSTNARLLKSPASLPDALFTALSLLVLFSTSPKPNSLFFLPNNIKFSSPQNLRKFPKMSLPITRTIDPRNSERLAPAFATPQSLSDWLKPRMSVDLFGTWGVRSGTKNVHNLWLEIVEGETLLADSTPPVRNVEVVIVRIIRNDGRVLIESHQELSNGVIRKRCRPLSEKMKPSESVEGAVVRALREELGSLIKIEDSKTGSDQDCSNVSGVHGNVRILPGSYVNKVEERASASYPGLPACYVLHIVDTEIEGLPDEDFYTDETGDYGNLDEANAAVSCKRHYWRWVDSDSV